MTPKQQEKLSTVPSSVQGVFERAYSGRSPTAGIKAFCLDCVGFVRADILDCTSFACPLHPYRPYRKDEEE